MFHIPALRTLARHTAPHVFEGRVVPLALFTTSMQFMGTTVALMVALAWSYGLVLLRAGRGKRVPGVLVLGTLTLTARTLVSLITGSTFVYFLQPTLSTVLVGVAFLVSVPLGRPLVERFAGDVCPLPDRVRSHPAVRRFFLRASVLWSVVHLANAAATLWFITTHDPSTYLVERSVISAAITGLCLLWSVLWFRRSTSRAGMLAVTTLPVPVA